MRVRLLVLGLLFVLAVDADILLWNREQPPPSYGEPVIIVHDRPELALSDEPPSFGTDILAALADSRYEVLEAQAAKLRNPGQRFSGGIAQITRFYEILTSVKTTPTTKECSQAFDQDAFAARRTQLEAWQTALPDEPTPVIALTEFWSRAGRVERGCAYASETSEAQWAGMHADFEKARSYLAGVDLDRDPVAYSVAMDLQQFESPPRQEIFDLYARAIKAFPGYYPFYAEHAEMLQKKWHGRPGELADYLARLRAPENGTDGQIRYAFAAFRLLEEYGQPDGRNAEGLTLNDIVAAYQVREQRFGLRDRDWKALFYFALRSGKCELAHEAVQHMDQSWDSTVWYYRESFETDIAWYKANTPFKTDAALLGG